MNLVKEHCTPCEGNVEPMSEIEENLLLQETKNWSLVREGVHRIKKQFIFKNFKEAIKFVTKVAEIAEKEQHHPDIFISYNKVTIELFTHAIKGLSENDFIMAAKIDAVNL